MTREEAARINRIINDLATAITNDIAPIIQPDRPEGGYFGVPRSVLCYTDVLGLLYCGWSSKKDRHDNKIDFATPAKAKTFIKEVLSQVDKLYGENGDLLYDMYRHGTVHLHSPKKMKSKTEPNKTIEWLLYKGDREQWDYYESRSVKFRHLQIIEWETDRYMLPVSIVVLYKDLLVSLELYNKMIFDDTTGELAKNVIAVADGLDKHYDSTTHKFWQD